MHVLVAEDHPIVRQALVMLLRQRDPGGVADASATFADALQMRGPHDLVLLDLMFPGECAGVQTVSGFHAAHPDTPILIVSGAESDEAVPALLSAGALGYAPKSAQPDALWAAIETVARGRVWLPPELRHRLPPSLDRARTPHPHQMRVLALMAEGLSDKGIARLLNISEETVGYHVKGLFRWLGANSRAQVVAKGYRAGLLTFGA